MLLNQVKGNLDRHLLDQNHFEPQLAPHNINSLIQQSVDMLQLQAQVFGIQIKFIGPSEAMTVIIDKLRVQQILVNLIQNAIKFSKRHGDIEVSLERFSVEKDGDVGIRVKVTDQGVGISPDDR